MKQQTSAIRVGTEQELAEKGHLVVSGVDRPIVVFHNDGEVCAVDNRCPHMGFPLHKGQCNDGVIICPWHHARFEAHSGCTFDLFAGDVEPFDVTIENGIVFVSSLPRPRDGRTHAHRRLREGMEMSNSLVCAKAIMALQAAGTSGNDIVQTAALFGARNGDEWRAGLTSLVALTNLLPYLSEETAYIALYQGVRRVAADSSGQPMRRQRYALETDRIPTGRLEEWMRSWVQVRHRDGLERTLLTAIENDMPAAKQVELLSDAAFERIYADGGHVADFANKSFDLMDLIGWEHALEILPTHTAHIARARGMEEQNNWRQPIDLVPLMQELNEELPALFEQGSGKNWNEEAAFAQTILSDDPLLVLQTYREAIAAGASPVQLAKATTYAAARRLIQFSAANEIGDWLTALHTFSYCHAVHKIIQRAPSVSLVRGVIQGGLSIYQDRFLNVPPLRLPAPPETLPTDATELRQLFLDTLDRSTQNHEAAQIVGRYLDLGHPVEPLIDTLTYAVAREDADFHAIQMVEAAVSEYFEWGGGEEGRTLLVAAARYLAAFSPTQRAQLQTARIAWRLHRGEKLYEEEESATA